MFPTSRNIYSPSGHLLEAFSLCNVGSCGFLPPYLVLVILAQREYSHWPWKFQEKEILNTGAIFSARRNVLYHRDFIIDGSLARNKSSSWRVLHPRVCLGNKSGFSHRAHLVPTYTFGETEVYDQVLFHKDSYMYKFQSYFRQMVGFYFCIFYGRGFRQGSIGLLPYPLPIVTVGESCSQPLGQLSFCSTSTSGLPNLHTPHHQRREQPRGRSWELTWDMKGLGPGKEKEFFL